MAEAGKISPAGSAVSQMKSLPQALPSPSALKKLKKTSKALEKLLMKNSLLFPPPSDLFSDGVSDRISSLLNLPKPDSIGFTCQELEGGGGYILGVKGVDLDSSNFKVDVIDASKGGPSIILSWSSELADGPGGVSSRGWVESEFFLPLDVDLSSTVKGYFDKEGGLNFTLPRRSATPTKVIIQRK
jgi:hypothetical protein